MRHILPSRSDMVVDILHSITEGMGSRFRWEIPRSPRHEHVCGMPSFSSYPSVDEAAGVACPAPVGGGGMSRVIIMELISLPKLSLTRTSDPTAISPLF